MDTVRALRQVIMFKEVPEPVLKIDLLVFRSAKVAEALAAHPEAGLQFYRAIARTLARHLRRAAGMISFSNERKTQC